MSIKNEGYLDGASGLLGADDRTSGVLLKVQVAILANSHSVMLSNGRKYSLG